MTNPTLRLPARRADLWAAGGFALLAALFYAPLLLGLRTFPDGDFTHHFLPFSLFQQHELRAGRLPVWNPYTYAGHPFLADVQAAVFYPLSNLLLLLTLPFGSAAARLYFLQAEAALHLALAGFFTYLLLRDLTGGRRWAAFTGGVLFAFSGYLTGYPPVQLAVLRTAVWLPLLLWLLWRAAAAPRRIGWWAGVAAAGATAFLAGHSQTFLLLAYAAGAWALLLLGAAWRQVGGGRALAIAGGCVTAVVLAAALSAGQLLPSLEFAQLSVRAQADYAFLSGGFPWQDFWQLLLPGVLTQYSPLYIGAAGLLLAAAGLLSPRSAGAGGGPLGARAAAWYFAALALVALLLSVGGSGFLYPLFYRLVPGFDLFRGQERAAYLVAFSLSALGGLGAAALPMLAPAVRHRLALAGGAAITAGVYAFGLLWQLPGRTAMSDWRYLALAAVTLLLSMAVALIIWTPGWSTRRGVWLAALAAGNLFLANMGANLSEFGPARATLLAPEMEALGQAVAEAERPLGLPGRVYNEFRIYEDYGMRQGIEDVWGSSPLRLAAYAALFDEFPLDRMWRLTGVQHVLTWRRELFAPSVLLAEFPQAADTTYLHRLADVQPRAWIARGVRFVDDDSAAALLADHGFDLSASALLPADDWPGAVDVAPPASPSADTPALAAPAPGLLQLRAELAAPGLLLVSENWLPGWEVRCTEGCSAAAPVLGLPAFTVSRAHLTLLAVPLPAGAHELELVYRPASVRRGLWISGAALAVLAGALLWAAAARRRGGL